MSITITYYSITAPENFCHALGVVYIVLFQKHLIFYMNLILNVYAVLYSKSYIYNISIITCVGFIVNAFIDFFIFLHYNILHQ